MMRRVKTQARTQIQPRVWQFTTARRGATSLIIYTSIKVSRNRSVLGKVGRRCELIVAQGAVERRSCCRLLLNQIIANEKVSTLSHNRSLTHILKKKKK